MISTGKFLISIAILGVGFFATSCGYTLKRSVSPDLEKYDVRRVYVPPVKNETFKPGIENVVYNSLTKAISADARLALVASEKDADAVLIGIVTNASYSAFETPSINTESGANELIRGRPLAVSYNASMTCSFSLKIVKQGKARDKTVWSNSFIRYHAFPASNLLGAQGATAALINESEFDRALQEMADLMMPEATEQAFGMF